MTHFGILNFPATKYKIASGKLKALAFSRICRELFFKGISMPEWKKKNSTGNHRLQSRNIMYIVQED